MRPVHALLAMLLLVAAACGGAEAPTAASGSAPPTQAASSASPGPGQATSDALAFTATTVAGDTFDGGEFAGQDLMLWFWAPW